MKPTDEEIIDLLIKHGDKAQRGMETAAIAKHFNLIGTYWMRKQLKRLQRHSRVKTCYPFGHKYCWTSYRKLP